MKLDNHGIILPKPKNIIGKKISQSKSVWILANRLSKKDKFYTYEFGSKDYRDIYRDFVSRLTIKGNRVISQYYCYGGIIYDL